jgi:glutathione synthase
VVHAPLAVLPAPFPAASFTKACNAATAFNSLIAAVAADSEYLQRTLAPAAEYDDFTVSTFGSADSASLSAAEQ